MKKFHNLLAFLNDENVVAIRNADEMARFVSILQRHKLERVLGGNATARAQAQDYGQQMKIVKKNADRLRQNWDGSTVYFEKQRGYDILGCYAYTQDVASWYGQEPFFVDEIDDKEDD